MTECSCFDPDTPARVLTPEERQRRERENPPRFVRVGMTNYRYGDVTIHRCEHCGTLWLHYAVAWEGYTGSGRWFQGVIDEATAATIKPEEAVAYLESLPWYIAGGSYFRSTGFRTQGEVRADLF